MACDWSSRITGSENIHLMKNRKIEIVKNLKMSEKALELTKMEKLRKIQTAVCPKNAENERAFKSDIH